MFFIYKKKRGPYISVMASGFEAHGAVAWPLSAEGRRLVFSAAASTLKCSVWKLEKYNNINT